MPTMTQSTPQESQAKPAKSNGSKSNGKNTPTAPKNESLVDYFKGVKAEWTKVSWPTWPQVWGQTIVVLVMTAIITLGLFSMDFLIGTTVRTVTPQSEVPLDGLATPNK